MPGYRWRRSVALDTSQVIPPDPQGFDELIGAGAAERTKNRQRRREASGFGQGRRGERRGQASSRAGEIAGREANVSGLLADDLILIKSRSPSSGPTSAATARSRYRRYGSAANRTTSGPA